MLVIGAAVLVLVWSVLPFLMMFWASLMTESQLVEGVVQIMEEPTLEQYERIFGLAETEAVFGGQTKRLALGFLNSLIVSLPSAFIATVIATLAGYAFGRFTFPGRMGLLFALLFTRVLPPIAVLIPYFSLFQAVGLVNTHIGLMLTYPHRHHAAARVDPDGLFRDAPDRGRARRSDGRMQPASGAPPRDRPDGAARHQRRLHHRLPVLLERASVRDHPGRRHQRPDPLTGSARESRRSAP